MPLDREVTLKKAEKLLRQGRLDAAIAEYVRVVEDQPKDWNTANALGDLYMRAGNSQAAVAQFARIADHFIREGFYPKAGALFKKILKINPDDEAAQLSLAEIATRQGLLADAKSYYGAVGARRRARGDRRGADEIILKLGDLDAADVDARSAAARVLGQSGDGVGAGARFRQIHDDLLDRGRRGEALAALREAVRFNPADREGRATLAREALDSGDLEGARTYLDRATAGDDPELLLAFAGIELRSGQLDTPRDLLLDLLARDRGLRGRVIELAWALAAESPAAGLVCVERVVESDITAGELVDAASVLQEFVARVPNQIKALLRLVEVCVEGGLEATMFEAQGQLADAYLAQGQPGEARAIAEDLVAREPWEHIHIERFRKSLIMLNVPEPDAVIAERLSGTAPFVAQDPFSDGSLPDAFEEAADGRPSTAPQAPPPAVAPHAASQPAKQPPAAKRPPGPVEIDLSSVLADLTDVTAAAVPTRGTQAPGKELEEVFQDFRDEVARQSGVDDAAQHMALASTYLEMGMEDDAIESLKQAARSPRHRFEAGQLLAGLFKKKNDLAQAVEWMERAAEAPAPSAEAGLALLYELGSTLEGLGETARALAVFMELQAEDGEYRDVSPRVERLARVQTGG